MNYAYEDVDAAERNRAIADLKERWNDLKDLQFELDLKCRELELDRNYLRGEASAYKIELD